MFKYLWACALTVTATLSADLIGNLDFQFPPSKSEWTLLTDDQLVKDFTAFFTSEAIFEDISTQIFTHREGDALEILWIAHSHNANATNDEEESEEASDDSGCCEIFRRLFPNHHWNYFEIHEDLLTYGFSDKTSNLLHGYARNISQGNEEASIFYLSTAVETEQSRAMWLHALESATLR